MEKVSAAQVMDCVAKVTPYLEYIDAMSAPMTKQALKLVGKAGGALVKALPQATKTNKGNVLSRAKNWVGDKLRVKDTDSTAMAFLKGMTGAGTHGATKANLDWVVAEPAKFVGRRLPFAKATRKADAIAPDGAKLYREGGKWQNDPTSKNLGDYLYRGGERVENFTNRYLGGNMATDAASLLRSRGHTGLAKTVERVHKYTPWGMYFGAPAAGLGLYTGGGIYDRTFGDVNDPSWASRKGEEWIKDAPQLAPMGKYHPLNLAIEGIGSAGTAAWNSGVNYIADQADQARQQAVNTMMDNRGRLALGLTFAPDTTRDFINREAGKLVEQRRINYLIPGSDEWNQAVTRYVETYGESPIQ